MATRNLTQNVDNLTGTSGADLFSAPLFTSSFGTQSPTLQTNDRLNGGAGNDRLEATLLADGNNLVQSYFARPLLTAIETVQVTSLSGNTGVVDEDGNSAQSPSTLDFLQSSGIKNFISESSNNLVQVRNAGDISTYKVRDTITDPNDTDGLRVTGVTRANISVTADNVFSADLDNLQTLSFATKSGSALNDVAFTVIDSQVDLDAQVDGALKIASGGTTGSNFVTLEDSSYSRVILSGSAALALSTGGEGFNVSTAFDAGSLRGSLTVNENIFGDLTVLRGSKGDDTFRDISSDTSGTFAINLGGGNNVVDDISAENASIVRLNSGSGNDYIDDIFAQAVNVNLGSGNDETYIGVNGAAASTVELGGGNDYVFVQTSGAGSVTINGGNGSDEIVVDAEFGAVTIDAGGGTDRVYVNDLATGVSNSISLGGNSDLLDITNITPDLTSTIGSPTFDSFDGGTGAGTDRIVGVFAGGLTAEEGSHITNFETLDLVGNSAGAFDLGTGLSSITKVTAEHNGADLDFSNVTNNVTFELLRDVDLSTDFVGDAVGGNILHVDLGSAALLDGIDANLNLNNETNTLDLTSRGIEFADENSVFLSNRSGLTSISIDGSHDLDVGATSGTSAVTSVDASTFTGDLDLTNGYAGGSTYTGLGIADSGATITGGAGNDTLIGGIGADVFNLSSGGNDSIVFRTAGDSDLGLGQGDRVTSFTSHGDSALNPGDTLVFNAAYSATPGTTVFGGNTGADVTQIVDGTGNNTLVTSLNFLGNATSFVEAQAAIGSFHNGDVTINLAPNEQDYGAVFDTSSNTLYVDANHDGSLTQADMQIVLTGLPTGGLSFHDLGLTGVGVA